MDNADPKLESSIEPLRHHLRGPTTGSGSELSPQTSFPHALTQKDLQAPNDVARPLASLILWIVSAGRVT
jgi:hypothetical protein